MDRREHCILSRESNTQKVYSVKSGRIIVYPEEKSFDL
jgi:hypothetical protein